MKTRYGARILCLVLATVGFVRAPQTANQAPPRLVTRWAKDVRPDNVWPEYPRPQMVRPAWQNLNGLWHYAITARDATPAADAYRGTILVPFAVESSLSGARACGHAGSAPVVSPHVQGARPARPADASCCTSARSTGRPPSPSTASRSASTRRLRSVHLRHHRRADARRGEQETRRSRLGPDRQGSAAARQAGPQPAGIWYTAVTGIWQTVWLETGAGDIRRQPASRSGCRCGRSAGHRGRVR